MAGQKTICKNAAEAFLFDVVATAWMSSTFGLEYRPSAPAPLTAQVVDGMPVVTEEVAESQFSFD